MDGKRVLLSDVMHIVKFVAAGDLARDKGERLLPESELIEELEKMETLVKNPEWWATYNAAITGMLVGTKNYPTRDSYAHKEAVRIANIAHGMQFS